MILNIISKINSIHVDDNDLVFIFIYFSAFIRTAIATSISFLYLLY